MTHFYILYYNIAHQFAWFGVLEVVILLKILEKLGFIFELAQQGDFWSELWRNYF